MKLVFLYGPPAVGKLTVAEELSKLTGFKVFHNHLTIDLVGSIFGRGTKIRTDLVNKYRIELIEAAAKEGVDVIFTLVYAAHFEEDDDFVKRIVQKVKKHGGEICFVRLHCSQKELFRRLKSPSRKLRSKLKKVKALKETMRKYDLFSDVPYKNNIAIDNTALSAKEVARKIVSHFGLTKNSA